MVNDFGRKTGFRFQCSIPSRVGVILIPVATSVATAKSYQNLAKIHPNLNAMASSPSIHIIAQRYRYCRLLVQERHWIRTPSLMDDDEQHCGLLLYVSFAVGSTPQLVRSAAETCLNLPVLTTGLWGDGVSEQLSIRSVVRQRGKIKTSLTIVPQANLISKVKSQGKSIQYHGQITKEVGKQLYDIFVDAIRCGIYEEYCDGTTPNWYNQWKQTAFLDNAVDSNPSPDPSIPEIELYRSDPQYRDFDTNGIPQTFVSGEPLTKSAIKKLKKYQEAHSKRHAKWKEKQIKNPSTNFNARTMGQEEVGTDDIFSIEWDELLEKSCPVIVGSFGLRQGLEFYSDMGPFCHELKF
jgi:hypothetical protein